MSATTISFRTDEEKKERLDKIAQSLDRDRSWVINEAVSNYVELYSWQVEHIEKALRNADHSTASFYDVDAVRARFAAREAERRQKAEASQK